MMLLPGPFPSLLLMRLFSRRWLLAVLVPTLLTVGARPTLAQTKVKSVPFAYVPDKSADPYAERVPDKLLPLPDGTFLLLTRRTAQEYAVEHYAGTDLKKRWSCP